jgi:phasin family protein
MATRTPAAKRPARKATGAGAKNKSAAKVAARPRKPRAKSSAVALAAAAVADDASLRDLATRLGKLELAGLAGNLVQSWRKDLESIAQASRKSYAGLQTIVSRQTMQIKDAVAELRTVGKVMTVIGPKESVRSLDDLALASLELALADIRELAELAANSQREAFDIVQQRVTENIDEVQQLLRK